MTKISGIYKIINKINDKYYVGSSCNMEDRFYKHKYLLNRKKHPNIHLQRAWIQQNKKGFKFTIIQRCEVKALIPCEQTYLEKAKLEKEKCYNISFIAGRIEMNADTRNKISQKSKIRLQNPTNHPMFGKHHSKKTKKLIATNSVKRGKENGMYGVRRFGKNNPNYGKGDKIRGRNNYHFDYTIYKLKNKITDEIFEGTQYDFRIKFNLSQSLLRDLKRGWIQQSKGGWTLATPSNSSPNLSEHS